MSINKATYIDEQSLPLNIAEDMLFSLLYDGHTAGPYHGGRYLSAAILTPGQQGGTIVLPKAASAISEQTLMDAPSQGWQYGHCLKGKHANLYDEQSPCVSHPDVPCHKLCSTAAMLLQAHSLPEALIKEAATGKVTKIRHKNLGKCR